MQDVKKDIFRHMEFESERTSGVYCLVMIGKAKTNQVRACCSYYPDMFDLLPSNYIKLKEVVE